MVALLGRTEQKLEEATQRRVRGSGIEREILDLLRRPARYPLGVADLKHELLRFYSELQIQNAIFHLIDEGLVETVYTSHFDLRFQITDRGVIT